MGIEEVNALGHLHHKNKSEERGAPGISGIVLISPGYSDLLVVNH